MVRAWRVSSSLLVGADPARIWWDQVKSEDAERRASVPHHQSGMLIHSNDPRNKAEFDPQNLKKFQLQDTFYRQMSISTTINSALSYQLIAGMMEHYLKLQALR